MPTKLKPRDDRTDLTAGEKTIIAASVVLSLALFGYLAYQAVSSPADAVPRVSVEAAQEGAWLVLANEGGTGIGEATIAVTCGDAETEIGFTNVPAASQRRALVYCEESVEAELLWWTDA